MSATRQAFGLFAVGIWAILLVYNLSVLFSIARSRALQFGTDSASVLVPFVGLLAAAYVAFSRPKSDAAATIFSCVLLLIGGFFLVVVSASRTG